MQFIVTQQHLDRGLHLVSHAVSNKPTYPIQAHILATSEGKRIRLSAANEAMGIHCWIPAEHIEEDGVTLLPAKLLIDFVSHLPPAPVAVTTPSSHDPMACHIQCQRIHADIKNGAENPDEFPSVATYADGGTLLLQMDTIFLKEIIEQVIIAANPDSNRSCFRGLHLELGREQATFAAADSFRLAVHSIPIPDERVLPPFLLPARPLIELARILPSEGSIQLVLTPHQNQMLFHMEDLDYSVRLLEATFPEFRQAIPPSYHTRAWISTQELTAAIRLMLPFARESKQRLRLKLFSRQSFSREGEPNTLHLEAMAQDVGHHENVLHARVEGENQQVLLNLAYLDDALAVIDTPEVMLDVVGPTRPVVLRPTGLTNAVHVLMPLSDQDPDNMQGLTRTDLAPAVVVR